MRFLQTFSSAQSPAPERVIVESTIRTLASRAFARRAAAKQAEAAFAVCEPPVRAGRAGWTYTATQDHSGQQARRVRARDGIVAAASLPHGGWPASAAASAPGSREMDSATATERSQREARAVHSLNVTHKESCMAHTRRPDDLIARVRSVCFVH